MCLLVTHLRISSDLLGVDGLLHVVELQFGALAAGVHTKDGALGALAAGIDAMHHLGHLLQLGLVGYRQLAQPVQHITGALAAALLPAAAALVRN